MTYRFTQRPTWACIGQLVIHDIFEVLRIRKFIELLQYFLITLHTLMVTMINKQIYEIDIFLYLWLPSHFIIVESRIFYFTMYKIDFNFDCEIVIFRIFNELMTYRFSWSLIALAHWSNRNQMLPHSDTLSWFWANQSLLFLFNAACLAEKQQIPIS
jgi:hypothetical protein